MSRLTATAGSSPLDWSRTRAGWLARVADYVELTKPRIVVLELVDRRRRGPSGGAVGRRSLGAACTRCSARHWSPPAPAHSTNGWNAATDAPHAAHRRVARCPPAGSRRGKCVVFGAVTLAARRGRACSCSCKLDDRRLGARHLADLRAGLHAAEDALAAQHGRRRRERRAADPHRLDRHRRAARHAGCWRSLA